MRFIAWAITLCVAASWPAHVIATTMPRADDEQQPPGITFNFKDASFEQVIDFFSRTTGLPVVWEADAPEGSLNYLSPESYDRAEALRVLNIILQSRGVMLRISDDMLYLSRLDQMQRANIPTFVGELPDDVTADQIITVVRPLSIALAKPLAERLAGLVAEYGSVTAMEQQNSLVITETAAQVRRLMTIISELDRSDPDGQIEIFAIRHARAVELMEPLKALMSQRVERFVIDQRGEQRKIEEDEMQGLTITADDRTNSIIAKGTHNKIDGLREAIALLDVPAASARRAIRTIALSVLTPGDAANRLNQVYASLPAAERPTIIPLNDSERITIVGTEAAISEGAAVLAEIDGGDAQAPHLQREMSVIALEHAAPAALIAAVNNLLDPRQRRTTKLVAGPDGQSVIVAGPTQDAATVRSVVSALDRPAKIDRQVRHITCEHATPSELAQTLRGLAQRIAAADDRSVEPPTIDPFDDLSLLLITGTTEQHQAIAPLVATLDTPTDSIAQPLRILQLRIADADNLANTLMRQYNQRPAEERAVKRVAITADAQTNALIVAAHPDVLPEIQAIVDELNQADRRDYDGREIRIFPLKVARAEELARTIDEMFPEPPMPHDARGRPRPDLREPREVVVRADRQTNALIVDAPAARMPGFEQLVEQLDRQQILEQTEVRTYPVIHAELEAVARTLRELANAGTLSPAALDRAGSRVAVTVTTEPVSRTLIVAGPADIFERVEQVLSELDAQRAGLATSLRFVSLSHARAEAVAPVVRELLLGAQAGGARASVHIAADERLNALIISAPPAVLGMAEELVAQFDVDPETMPTSQRAVRVLSVRNADARELSTNLSAMFSESDALEAPPTIRVDAASNSLLIRATDEQFASIEQVVQRIDQATLAGSRQMHLIRVDPAKASADEVARTLQRMLEQGQPSRVRVISVDELRRQREQGETQPDRDRAQEQTPGPSPDDVSHLLPRSIWWHVAAASIGIMSENEVADDAEITIAVDEASNSLILLGSPRAVDRMTRLAQQIQDQIPSAPGAIRYVTLSEGADANSLARLLNQTLAQMTPAGGSRGQFRQRVSIIPDQAGNALIVACNDHDFETVGELIAALSQPAVQDLDIRSIVLERASASAVASAIQRLYDDRARITAQVRGRRNTGRQISIIGDDASRTVLVAANDDDFEQISQLVSQFDSPQATSALEFRVFELRHAKALDIRDTVQALVNDLIWGQGPVLWTAQSIRGMQQRGTVAIRADARLNALIVTGEGDRFAVIENLIDMLDSPVANEAQRIVRLYPIGHGRTQMVADVLEELFGDAGRSARRWWEPPDPSVARIRIDAPSNMLIISASAREHDDIAELIASLEGQMVPGEQQTRVLALQFAQANELAGTLRNFLINRARAISAPAPTATIIPSASTNSLIVSADEQDMSTIRDLLAQLDQDDVSGERVVEILVLNEGEAAQIGRIVSQQFASRGRGPQAVTVTTDVRTNSLIVSASRRQLAQVQALVERLDTPRASDETIIRTYALESAQAQDVQRLLGQTLQLDARGRTDGITVRLEDAEGPAVEVKARIVADRRSNSIIVTATEQSFPVIESLIARLDDVPTASQVEYRVIPLSHALADDVAFTLSQMARGFPRDQPQPRIDYNRFENQLIIAATADQFSQIKNILAEIDQPSKRERVTDFVPLQFAGAQQVQEALSVFYGAYAIEADTPAKRNVRIVADPATNSLVISAERDLWQGIRNLLAELDSEEYDASLQLRVLPLTHADARSVARAINEAFAGTLERSRAAQRQARQRGDDDRRDAFGPTVLVESEEWVRASAEPQTNSVIISASRQNIRKIEAIVDQMDIADYAKLPAPRLIPVTTGDPQRLAESINRLYQQPGEVAGKALRIVGDQASNTIIVRADEDEFAQIAALADALQQQAGEQGVTVHVLKLTSAPAARVASAIREGYTARARIANQPLSIQVDAQGNSLVIASTGPLFREISETVAQLDALAPSAGQSIFIIELENIAPDAARSVIESIGLHQRQPDDSVTRLVSEPIKVSVMAGRNALIIVANPADRETIVSLLKAVDAEPEMAEAQMRLVKLRNANANSVAAILREVLNPAEQQSRSALARAVQEQVRRLAVRRDGLNEHDIELDLTKPIRIVVDSALNALVISSTQANVRVIEQIIGMFDQLPITEAAVVRVFPLQNIAAEQFSRICRDLFTQGKRLNTVPGTNLAGVPAGIVGRALLDEIAIAIDERTNTVIVAGKEDAVGLVEVLTQRLDSDVTAGWVEPRILPLRFADAGELAQTLQSVLVEGATSLPQASPLQRQVGRLRLARRDDDGGRVLESDVFQPMTRLVIRPEPQLNALILVGTPMNLEVVTELVQMLDVEAASPSAAVRIYPVRHASAARLAQTITRLFDQQVQSKAIRPEDRAIVQADERTNALIVTTSSRSFAVLESLLTTLDSEIAPDLREIRRIELEHASATRMASLVQQMMDARLDRMRRVQPETADLERATVIAEPRTNSLIIAAGNESYEVILRLVADLDSSTLADAALVHVIPVSQGNVDRIAGAVNQIMDRRYADQPAEVRASQKPLVLTDPRTSSLLVAASPEDVTAIENLVARLGETPISPAVGLHVVNVAGTMRADQFAQRLQRLMQERQQTLGDARTPSDRVSIEADLASNSLIISCSDENLQVIRGLIDVLVQAGAESLDGREVELITLTTSRASDMIALLNDLHVREVNRVRGEGTIRMTADANLNAVLVSAPAGDLRVLKGLVSRLDGAKPTRVVETRFIPLQSANALETVNLIQNVLSGRGIGGGRGGAEQSTVLKYVRELARDRTGVEPPSDDEQFAAEMLVGAAVRESITLTPDVRTNTVIVSAPQESMRMIEQMIRDLDASSIGSQNIRIFKLVNADALAMARILTDLFSLQRQGNLFVLRPREAAMDGVAETGMSEAAFGGGLPGIELTAVPDERQQLAITVDSRTNSLLVSGTPTYLDLVENVITELDNQEASERETFVYPLRNAAALEVARVVTNFVDTEQQKLITTLGADQIGSAARLLEREITVVGDEKSNTILVSASPRYRERLEEIIEGLDVDPPQVLIQVLLAEVTLDEVDDWGVDMELRANIDSASAVAGFGLGSAFVNGMGVPSLAIASTDFDLLIRAMQSQGRLQVLSNPSVMAANNEPAFIQVGETIRLPSDVSVTDAGRTLTSVQAEEIGVILNVTPSINPDGFVRMVINPEISNLSARTTRISEDFEAPIITRRTAETTVTVFDGQTVVLGGLISDRFERRDRKVPLLGDLPFFGGLFRSMTQESIKTELLIVLTPHVIESPAELRRVEEMTDREIDRLSLPDEVKDSIRNTTRDISNGIRWEPRRDY